MNNQQFRKLVLDTPARQDVSRSTPTATGGATAAFGDKARARALMTPRHVRGFVESDFARQVASENAAHHENSRSFKSSSAPKGTKLAAGYHDRTQDRNDEDSDDKSRRIRALEEQLKLDQIDLATFESLRDEITGGDIRATHLVKGLDRKLLERVRRGEDVMSSEAQPPAADDERPAQNEDEELDELEAQAVAPVVREQVTKKGELAPPQPTGGKRKRDAILAELKAARKAAVQETPTQPQLGSHFRSIDNGPRVEVDEQGREVLIVVGEDGKVKRKVRKQKADAQATQHAELLQVDPAAKPLGIDAAELPDVPVAAPEEDDDDDIFEGVGADYDPLAALGEEEEEDGEEESPKVAERAPQSDPSAAASGPRNYFQSNEPSSSVFEKPDEAALIATLKRASAIASKADGVTEDADVTEEEARLKRRAAMLSNQDRDMDDLDMGFGSSRFGDAEEADGDQRIKLSQWKGGAGGDDDDDDDHGERGGKKRKRGPKKRKGDKDSAADVLRAMDKKSSS